MATKNKSKNTLPMILLPIAMLVAGITKIIISNIPEHVNYVLGIEDFYVLYSDVIYVAEFVGELAALIIIVLAALPCKGLTKKLIFVASAYTGTIAYMLVCDRYYWESLLWRIMDYEVAEVLSYIIYISSVLTAFAISVVIAMLMFKKLSGYEPKALAEGEKQRFDIKKLLLPSGLIVLASLLNGISLILYYEFPQNYYNYIGRRLIDIIWFYATYLLGFGVLALSVFFVKDKFKVLTCLASAALGYGVVSWFIFGVLYGALRAIISSIVAMPEGASDIVWNIVEMIYVITVAVFGVGFYILLNRKDMVSIYKAEE